MEHNHTNQTTIEPQEVAILERPINAAVQTYGPVLAECPADGGKWAIYCEHTDETGEVIALSILQDSNKRRLSEWKSDTSVWCATCQQGDLS